jgi:sugar-specific transcriptional regulator TrmB
MAKKMNKPVSAPPEESVVEDLMRAGFTEYEAKVYLSLLAHHPVSAYSISQNSGVPHSRVYDISRRLIKKGFAVSSGSSPELFSPLSPDELVEKIERDNDQLTRQLKTKLDAIDFVADFDPVWNLHSRDESLEKLKEMISGAEKKIFLGFWAEEFPMLEEDLRAAHGRGVQIFLLCYGQVDVDFGKVYIHERHYLDEINAQGRSIDCAVDSRVCLTGMLGNPGKTQVVWTRNQGLVYSIEGYIIHDFYLAEIRLAFGAPMDELFGENLEKLRKKFVHI